MTWLKMSRPYVESDILKSFWSNIVNKAAERQRGLHQTKLAGVLELRVEAEDLTDKNRCNVVFHHIYYILNIFLLNC